MANDTDSTTLLDIVEQVAKIGGLIAVPILVALFGYLVQKQLSLDNLSRGYIQIAVGILKEEKHHGDEQLRSWAIDLLNANSPTAKLNASISQQLKQGGVQIPASVYNYNYTTPRVSSYDYISPDGTEKHAAPTAAPPR